MFVSLLIGLLSWLVTSAPCARLVTVVCLRPITVS